MLSRHLQRLEAESIEIMREVAAEFANPVMLYSIGKDSGVMLHVALKAFYPSKPPFPLLHIDTGCKFRDMIRHRNMIADRYGLKLLVYTNPEGLARGINPITSGSQLHTQVMKTEALKQALDKWEFDAAFGGARRDEEKSRAKERIFSFRSKGHVWDPRNQRPELWRLYNTRINKGETIRVFPLSNWTELDVWQYTRAESIPVVPLYFAAPRPVVRRDGLLIVRDDERLRAVGPRDRRRRDRLDGAEEARGVFLMADATSFSRVPGEPRTPGGPHAQGDPHAAETGLRRTAGAERGGGSSAGNTDGKGLLRFLTCGSVDDGKSTLIGRLLYDSKLILEDQLDQLRRDSRKHGTTGDDIDLALLVDGLEAEREQGITIDVAYRFFSTPKRSFIVADTPGHEQYTRNMATGASNSEAAVILIDARKGVLTQTRRHSYICSLLGIRHIAVAVNKIDLVDFSAERFHHIVGDYFGFAQALGFASITPIPLSARYGDNVTLRSERMRWYEDRRCSSTWRRSTRITVSPTARSASPCSG